MCVTGSLRCTQQCKSSTQLLIIQLNEAALPPTVHQGKRASGDEGWSGECSPPAMGPSPLPLTWLPCAFHTLSGTTPAGKSGPVRREPRGQAQSRGGGVGHTALSPWYPGGQAAPRLLLSKKPSGGSRGGVTEQWPRVRAWDLDSRSFSP